MQEKLFKNLSEKYPQFKELILSNIKGNIIDGANDISFKSEQSVELLKNIIKSLNTIYDKKGFVDRGDVLDIIMRLNNADNKKSNMIYKFPKRIVKARTEGQHSYIKALNNNDIVIAIGPAGTGKTFLAVAKALHGLLNKIVRKIILTRPAVEAGENLGFLPGDLKEKVDPYLRPLYDSLYSMLERDRIERYINEDIIEIAPLAYMRGRTLADSYLILDEAQNTTSKQMKMFITRMGVNSKMIITGDITQIDLDKNKKSGLIELMHITKGIKGIQIIELNSKDVVRHILVKEIIDAYIKEKTD